MPGETRGRILDAALDVFSENGYHDSAVDDIVRRADSSKGTFYFHFPSKQAIFMALAEEAARRVGDAVERAVSAEQDPVERVDAALRAVLDIFARHRSLAKLLLVDLVNLGGGFGSTLAEVRAGLARRIAALLDDAIARGAIPPIDSNIAAYAWLGAVNEIVTRWLHTGTPTRLEDVLPTLRALLLGSLGAIDRTNKSNEQVEPTSRTNRESPR